MRKEISNSLYITIWVVIGFVVRIPRLNDSIYERFSFRQTQTAFGIRYFANESLNPLNAQVPVLGPPWKIPMEFPLFQLIAALPSKYLRIDEAISGRISATVFFLLSSILLFLILQQTNGKSIARISLPIFLLTSFSLEWGSAVLIDWLSVALTLSGIYLIIVHKKLNSNFSLKLILALAVFILASLTKVTTTVPWIIAFVLFTNSKTKKLMDKKSFTITSLLFLSYIPFMYWNTIANRIKSENPFTGFLVSDAMNNWNFGSVRQRLLPNNYFVIFERIDNLIIGSTFYLIVIITVVALIKQIDLTFFNFYLFTSLFSVAIFFNLYLVHDYYLIAIYPAIIAMLSIILGSGLELLLKNQKYQIVTQLPVIFVVLLTYISPIGKGYLNDFRTDSGIPDASQFIQSQTEKNSKIIMLGCDWDPTLLYFADRKGLMLMPGRFSAEILNESLVDGYQYVYVCGQGDLEILPRSVELIDKGSNLYKIVK